jgi:hypothetical protein
MLRAGVNPDLLDEMSWWADDDLWVWSLYALVVYARAAAEHGSEPVSAICQRIAACRGFTLTSAAS